MRIGDDGFASSVEARLLEFADQTPGGARGPASMASVFDRSDALDLVDQFLDLGRSGLDLTDLSKEKLAEAFKTIVELLKHGVVGYEYREINGAPRKVFIDVAIGSDLHRAPLWRNGRIDGYL